jgi:hypothetical protein
MEAGLAGSSAWQTWGHDPLAGPAGDPGLPDPRQQVEVGLVGGQHHRAVAQVGKVLAELGQDLVALGSPRATRRGRRQRATSRTRRRSVRWLMAGRPSRDHSLGIVHAVGWASRWRIRVPSRELPSRGRRVVAGRPARWRRGRYSGGPTPQHVDVVDAVPTGQDPMHQGQQLGAGVGRTRPRSEVDELVGGLLDPQPLSHGGGQQQSRSGDRVGVVKGDVEPVQVVGGLHRERALLIGKHGSSSRRHSPRSEGLSHNWISTIPLPQRCTQAQATCSRATRPRADDRRRPPVLVRHPVLAAAAPTERAAALHQFPQPSLLGSGTPATISFTSPKLSRNASPPATLPRPP